MRQIFGLFVPERRDPMTGGMAILSVGNVLELLLRVLPSGLVFLFIVVLADDVGMGRSIVQLFSALVVFVV